MGERRLPWFPLRRFRYRVNCRRCLNTGRYLHPEHGPMLCRCQHGLALSKGTGDAKLPSP